MSTSAALTLRPNIHLTPRLPRAKAQIAGQSAAFPPTSYTQTEIKQLLNIQNPTVCKFMEASHIQKRHLMLPEVDSTSGELALETSISLQKKFHRGIKTIGVQAVKNALINSGLTADKIDHLIAVTSSGFMVPGVSSMIAKALSMRADLYRLDIVGMGCNAGMNALRTASDWLAANPNRTALVLCCEINSANYVNDDSIRNGIVNSLFGDGAVATILQSVPSTKNITHQLKQNHAAPVMRILDFESFSLPEQSGAMRFDWDEEKNKWSFFLSKDIPFIIGQNIHHPVKKLLKRHGLSNHDIAHWILHTGGKAVIDGAKKSLNLTEHDVRHTRSVLRDFGNLSSGSFLLSLMRLHHEGKILPQDKGIMIAMGPGANIEACLVQWQ